MMSNRRAIQYLNYTTQAGVPMAQVARSKLSSFLLHDFGYNASLTGWNHQGVDSPFWRFYHNPSEGCGVRTGNQTIPLRPGMFVLIPADTLFDCVQEQEPAKHLWIHFTVTQPYPNLSSGPLGLSLDSAQEVLIREAIELHNQSVSLQRDRRLHALGSSIIHLATARIEPASPMDLPEFLVEALDFIQKSPGADLQNRELARRSGLPLEKFIGRFKRSLGSTPAAYVSETRVRLAAEALALTDESIDQIAVANGFPNRHYFSRVFSRKMGCGPAEFRRRQIRS